MKKLGALLLTGIMAASLAISANAAFVAEADLGKVAFDVQKARIDQKFDGKIEDGEYYEIAIKDSWLSYAAATDADIDAAKKVDKKLYMSWDDGGVRIAATIVQDKASYMQTQDAGNIWKEACIQVNLAATTDTGTNRLEYGIGRMSTDGSFIGNVWAQFKGTYTPEEGKNAKVTYENNTVTYETYVPWSNFLDNASVKEGSQFGFCLVYSIGTNGNHNHIQIASGCTGDPGKKADNFAKLTLAAAPELPPEPAESTETADTAVVASIALMAAAAAGVVIVSRKRG